MAGVWNARDHEYVAGESKLLHYTILHTQPWAPFPEQLRYGANANGELWHALEREADNAGYTLFTKAEPSARYHEPPGYKRRMHEEGRPSRDDMLPRTPSRAFPPNTSRRSRSFSSARIAIRFWTWRWQGWHHRDDPAQPGRYCQGWTPRPAFPHLLRPRLRPFSDPMKELMTASSARYVLEHILEEDILGLGRPLRPGQDVYLCRAAATQRRRPCRRHQCPLHQPALRLWAGQIALTARRNRIMPAPKKRACGALSSAKSSLKSGVRSRLFRGSWVRAGTPWCGIWYSTRATCSWPGIR